MSSTGRPTGTVPKVKSRPNMSSRDLEQRRAPISSVPNNLQASSLEWQQSTAQASSSHSRPRKSRNTRQLSRDLFDGSADSHERLRSTASDFSTRVFQGDFMMDGERSGSYDPDSQRRVDSSSSQQGVPTRRHDGQPNNTLLDTKNNISKIPDRNQVLSRLNQIRDYVKQTSALMDSLRGSSDPQHKLEVIKLKNMNEDLQDSEKRLVELLSALNVLAGGQEPIDNCSTPEHLERFTQLLDLVKTQEDCLGLFKDGHLPESMASPQSPPNGVQPRSRGHSVSESFTRSRSSSEEPRGMPTAAQYAKHQELKLKVEESQKKLQALQEHQAALVALQHKAQEQLREAQEQQGALLARADEDSQTNGSANLENLNHRMQSLQDMFLNRNEVVHLLGEQDDELEAEHSALQERLQELHGRKQVMDRLVRDLQAFGDSPAGNHNDSPSQQNGVDVSQTESSEEEGDVEAISQVSDKMEELSRMKARLAQLQAMVSAVNNGEVPHETVKAALTSDAMFKPERRDEGCNRGQERISSSKPDNIALSSESTPGYLEAQVIEIQMKTQQLDKAKQRLQQLRELLGAVGMADDDAEDGDDREEATASHKLSLDQVQAMSRDIRLQTVSLQAEREQLASAQNGASKPAPSAQQHSASQAKNKNRDTARRNPQETVQEGASSRQLALQAELRAKRQELEELMRKDQGQSFSVNQDTCSEAEFSLPETSATWGGSSSSQTALLATVEQDVEGQEPSMACSSDDALDEPLQDASTQMPQPSRHRQQSHPSLPQGGPFQPGWHQFRPKYEAARNDSAGMTESRATTPHNGAPWLRPGVSPALGPDPVSYELPGSVNSSRATPRPPSESGSTNTQQMPWWPMQVQQQLEVTNAMCQAMMQQWQWSSPGPEPWWNMQGATPPLQQQQLVLTLSQCCHMLWMQHREMAALHATVQALQERIACAERCGLAAAAAAAVPPPDNNQATPSSSHHQPLKVSLSTGLFPLSPSEQAAGVSSAHSLPNLCDGPHPSTSALIFPLGPTGQYAWMSPPQVARASSNAQACAPTGIPPLLRHGPPATLNNQVPPGIRANNYWDNFRSYSRQNLLSASTKSNEGHMHAPSPIADRSHNSLRGADPQQVPPAAASVNVTHQPYRSRKQKLNTEQRPLAGPSTSNSSASPSRHNPGPSHSRHGPVQSRTHVSSSAMPTQEQLYSELATLVAQNQSRPEFLPQLFRELQALSSDSSLCQRALQSIREISHTARGESRNTEHVNSSRPRSRESLGSHPSDKEDGAHGLGACNNSGHGLNMSHHSCDIGLPAPLLEEAAGSEDSVESQEGATALPSMASRVLTRNLQAMEPCSPDLSPGGLNLSSGHSHLDVEIQGVILQLLPYFKAHREDCCTIALLEAVRQRTLSLVPQPVTGLNGIIHGQLDALLEDAMLKFQGCWLRDVGEELLATIAEVLLNELTFFKLLDCVGRTGPTTHASADSTSGEPCQPSGLPIVSPAEDMMEAGADLGHMGAAAASQRNCWIPARLREPSPGSVGWEARADTSTLEVESMLGCDGDLAEADQSHEDGHVVEVVTSSGNPPESLGDGPVSGRNSQAEGIAADDSSSDLAEDEMDNVEDLGAAALTDNQTPTEDEAWHVEQDRDLDQVPTRLEPGGNASLPQSPPPSSSPSSPRP